MQKRQLSQFTYSALISAKKCNISEQRFMKLIFSNWDYGVKKILLAFDVIVQHIFYCTIFVILEHCANI